MTAITGEVPWLVIPLITGRITFALAVNAVALWSRRAVGLLLSAASLLWVLGEYLHWYIVSYSQAPWLRWDAAPPLPLPLLGRLYGGSWWNIVALLVTILLFAWVVKVMVIAWRARPGPPSSKEFP